MKGPGSFAGCLLGARHESLGTDGDSAAVDGPALDLADIQGFVLRAYRMPMVRHFVLTVGDPAAARRQLGRLVSGDESDVPQITTAEDWHVGFAPGPGDDPAAVPHRKPDYCLNIGITWPGLVALEVGTASLRCPSGHLARSSKGPRNERSRSEKPDRVRPRTGSAVSEKGMITCW